MPLKKYTTSSVLISSSSSVMSTKPKLDLSAPTTPTSIANQTSYPNKTINTITTSSLNEPSLSSSPNSNETERNNHHYHLNNYLVSLTECLPQNNNLNYSSNLNTSTSSTASAASSSSPLSSSPQNNSNRIAPNRAVACTAAENGHSHSQSLPSDIRARLYVVFAQIEKEFDQIYAENARLKRELSMQSTNSNNTSPATTAMSHENTSLVNSSTSTLVASNAVAQFNETLRVVESCNKLPNNEKVNSKLSKLAAYASQPASSPVGPVLNPLLTSSASSSTAQQHVVTKTVINQQLASLTSSLTHSLAQHSQSAKSALLSSKTRINNLSFPKFKKPNANGARDFILQSIKNNSSKNNPDSASNSHPNNINSKLQCTLQGHKDGIWDINCLPIPSNLVGNSTSINLLMGTASADHTARLWYFNWTSGSAGGKQLGSLLMSPQHSGAHTQVQTSAFCIQEYCGHTGSVNSLRFHPKFFTEATNLILTGGGDCQAHIWQCVLSPNADSFESCSEMLLNYSNCHSIAMANHGGKSTNSLLSPQIQSSSQLPSSISCPSANSLSQFSSPSGIGSFQQPLIASSNKYYQDMIANTAIIRSPIKRYEGHSDACIAAEWFPDGEQLATASWDRTANVFNVETGKSLCQLQHDDYLTNVSIHRVHKIILTSSKDTTFKIWDFRDPICSVQIYQGHNRSVNSAIFVGDAQIATASDDQTLKLWDLRVMRSPVCTIHVNSGVNRICTMTPNFEHTNPETIYLCLPLDNRDIKVYNLQGERITRLPRNSRGVGHRRLVTSVASYGNLLFSASFDKIINCWSLEHTFPKSAAAAGCANKAVIGNKENHEMTNLNTETTFSIASTSFSTMLSNSANLSASVADSQLNMSLIACGGSSQTMGTTQMSQQSPFTHITNKSSTNPLSKLAERIKI